MNLPEKKQPSPESAEFYEGLLQIFKDTKNAVEVLETEAKRRGVGYMPILWRDWRSS